MDLGSKVKQGTASEASPTEFKHTMNLLMHKGYSTTGVFWFLHLIWHTIKKSSQVQWSPPSIRKKDVSFNKCDVLKAVLLN